MANRGWYGTRQEWARLEKPLIELNPLIDEFAAEARLEVTRNHKDWPERSLAWGGQVRCLIQLYLVGKKSLTFDLWLCADQDRAARRFWKQATLIKGKTISQFKAELPVLLRNGCDQLKAWSDDPVRLEAAPKPDIRSRSVAVSCGRRGLRIRGPVAAAEAGSVCPKANGDNRPVNKRTAVSRLAAFSERRAGELSARALEGRLRFFQTTSAMEIKLDNLDGAEVAELLSEHLENMAVSSPPESVHALDMEGLRRPDVTFWSVWEESELIGIGALKELDAWHAEIKSMRTASSRRRKGVAGRLLRHLIEESRRRGYRRISLETGSQDVFEPARRLYASFGFTICEPFGDYVEDPNSVFMTREL